jgi:hypothetical protein
MREDLQFIGKFIQKQRREIEEFCAFIQYPHAVKWSEKVSGSPRNDQIPRNIVKLCEMKDKLNFYIASFFELLEEIPDEKTRKICIFKYVDALTAKEIGEKFGKTRKWVYDKINKNLAA